MQVQFDFAAVGMRIMVDVIDAAGVEGAGPANNSVNFIAFVQQQLCQVGAVLAGDAGNERFFQGYLLRG